MRLRLSDYYSVAKHAQSIRILHSTIDHANDVPVIEADVGATVVMGAFHVRRDEVIVAAELFSGAFAGWTQAATLLHHLEVPIRVRWALDQDPSVWPSLRMVHERPLFKVENEAELQMALEGSMDIFALATFQHRWWHRLLSVSDLEFLLASPPCPAWSTASHGPGLDADEGKLFLYLFALLEVSQVPCLLVEQVSGFKMHQHYACLQEIWESIGYKLVWDYQLDLVDCAPGSRPRYLMLLVRFDKIPSKSIPRLPFVVPRRPTLESFQCVVSLPPDLLQPCLLDESTLALYYDPELLPTAVRRSCRPVDAQLYRLRKPNQHFGCVMAQYHRQHELPHEALRSKGLLGQLLDSSQGIRFLSGLETSFLHGLVRPYVLHSCDQLQMRHIGNSLSVFQSSFALVHGLQAAQGLCSVPEPTLVLHTCLTRRTHAGNFRLASCEHGWLVYQEYQLPDVQQKWPFFGAPSFLGGCDSPAFRCLVLSDGLHTCRLALAPALTVPAVLEAFGLEAPVDELQQLAALPPLALPEFATATCPRLLVAQLGLLAPATSLLESAPVSDQPLMWVWAEGVLFVLPRTSPQLYRLLEAVHAQCAALHPGCEDNAVWLDPYGGRVLRFQQFRGGCSLHFFEELEPWPIPCVDPEDIAALRVHSCVGPTRVQIPADIQHRLQSVLCSELFEPVGWKPLQWTQDSSLHVVWREVQDTLRLPGRCLLPRCALLFFKACLQYLHLRGSLGGLACGQFALDRSPPWWALVPGLSRPLG